MFTTIILINIIFNGEKYLRLYFGKSVYMVAELLRFGRENNRNSRFEPTLTNFFLLTFSSFYHIINLSWKNHGDVPCASLRNPKNLNALKTMCTNTFKLNKMVQCLNPRKIKKRLCYVQKFADTISLPRILQSSWTLRWGFRIPKSSTD